MVANWQDEAGGGEVIGRCSLGIYSGPEFLSGTLGPSCGRERSHVLHVDPLVPQGHTSYINPN